MRFSLPEDKRLVHQMVIPIRWGDMDAFHHVNNAVYFRYMETIRVEWLHSLTEIGAGDEGTVVASTFCNFLRPLEHPGDVLTKLYVAQVGRTSVDTYVTMERSDAPGVICAAGGAKLVWVNLREQRPIPLPQVLRISLG
jgi:acyl-CoA thioester hydrolase